MSKISKFTCGDPRLPPLIFLHGFMGCKEDWEGIIPYFADRYHCIAIDLPGHGSTPYSDDIFSALKDSIPAMAKTTPLLMGYSMGGRLAMQLSDVAHAIINISGHPGLKTQQEKDERLRIDEEWAKKLTSLPFDTFISEWYSQPIFNSLSYRFPMSLSIVKRRLAQNPQSLARVMMQMSLAHQEHREDFSCPALFLHGENDLKYRELFSRLPQTIAVRQIDNCGHAPHVENTEACVKTILNWMEVHANA